jgi:hypothetical protein
MSRALYCLVTFSAVDELLRGEIGGFSVERIAINSIFVLALFCCGAGFLIAFQARNQRFFRPLDRFFIFSLAGLGAFAFVRGMDLDPRALLTLFFNAALGGWVWLLPLLALVGVDRSVLLRLRSTLIYHTFIGSILGIAFLLDVYAWSADPSASSFRVATAFFYGIPLLLIVRISTRTGDIAIAYVSLIISSAIYVISVSRTSLAINLFIIAYSFCMPGQRRPSGLHLRMAFLAIICATIAFSCLAMIDYLPEPWHTDTRSFIVQELFEDLSALEILLGKGALGKYYSQYFWEVRGIGLGGDHFERQVVEIGYLHYILKLGLVGLTLYLVMALRTVRKAFGNRRDSQGLGSGVWVGLTLASMIVGAQPAFSATLVLFWLVVGRTLAETVPAAERTRIIS